MTTTLDTLAGETGIDPDILRRLAAKARRDQRTPSLLAEFTAATNAARDADTRRRDLILEADNLGIPRAALARAAGVSGSAISQATRRHRAHQTEGARP